VGMEPAVKPAAEVTRSGIVGVLATPATFQGKLFASVVERFAQGVELIEVVLPGLVEQIEAGHLESPATRRILQQGLAPLRSRGVDTLVLACTHYPFVIPLISRLAGPEVTVIDPAPAIARQAARLRQASPPNDPALRGSVVLVTSGDPAGLAWTFLGRNAAAVISALDQVTDLQLLQTPSVVVRNNAEATFNVGSNIPISSVTVNPVLGGGDTTISQVQYLETGTILRVRPRITRDGTVFLDIVQEVSSPGSIPDRNGNVRIDTRKLKTEAAIQSGDTVMLAGLISDGVTRGASGFPGLSRIPVLGGLFGTQTSRTERNEVIILLTPTIIRNPQDARDLTDEYGRRFRAMQPLQPQS